MKQKKKKQQKKWNSRLDDTEECINYLESKIMKINHDSNKEKEILKMKTV